MLEYNELTSLDSVRKKILDNKNECIFLSSRTNYYSQKIFNKSYKIIKEDGSSSFLPYEPDEYLYNMIIPESEKKKT